ncbi:hypothetical protein D9758_013114 [Tetrapyrgos nigripes]|uniref:Uncharacterized protein n=1 Tax=Tetrapyrgos nigripes TaxID=182062 RepID=A0A8H5FIR7_9AGAR|nr:hypothetical protein D9758_013114 [Tetrapyrgos nigripes]
MEYNPLGMPKLAARCPHLKYLEVFETWCMSDRVPTGNIMFSLLQILDFTCQHSAPLGNLLPYLHLPNLTSLSLRMDCSRPKKHTQDFLNNLRGMLEQSPQIRSLRLEELMFSDSELIEILPLVPSLQSLALLPRRYYHSLYTTSFFNALNLTIQSETTPVLIPGFTNLMLELQDITWFGEPSLRQRMAEIVSMLESRRASLRHFELHATIPDPY